VLFRSILFVDTETFYDALYSLSKMQTDAYIKDPRFEIIGVSVAVNDAISAAHMAHPDRFIGFAHLPFQNPSLALEELERAAKRPGIRGIYMATAVRDRELSDRSFFPVYERMADLGLPLFLHPMMINNERLKQWYLINTLGNPFEVAIAASHLIFGGVLDTFPELEVCLPHAGGALPLIAPRMDRGHGYHAACLHLPNPPSTYLRRFHYDTIGHSPAVLRFLFDTVGTDRVMIGSDYCFKMGLEQPIESLMEVPGLSDSDRTMILRGTAGRLLKLDA
jgi:aminocarboxymuconate-semialdehyde decarboxylase